MKTIYRIFFIIIPILVLSSCNNDAYTPTLAVGLWKQVSVSEDGIDMILTPEQKTCQLLIDLNGAYRCYHQSFKSFNNGNGPTSFYGSWNLTDGKWINFSVDKWQIIAPFRIDPSRPDSDKVALSFKRIVIAPKDTITVIDTLASVQKQWSQYHIPTRFSILQLSDTVMEIRLKTFVGEKNYALLFAPNPADFIELKPAPAGKPIYIPKLVTDQNYWVIRKELQTLKTYVFKFRKVSY